MTPDFELTRAALVERLGGRTFIYGRWDTLFGCWTRNDDGRAKRFTPQWPLLDAFGEPVIVDEGPAALLADYATLIPRDVRRVAGPFGSRQWAVLMMLNFDPAFENFLRLELRTCGPGFVAACMAMAGADAMDRDELRTLWLLAERLVLQLTVNARGDYYTLRLAADDVCAADTAAGQSVVTLAADVAIMTLSKISVRGQSKAVGSTDRARRIGKFKQRRADVETATQFFLDCDHVITKPRNLRFQTQGKRCNLQLKRFFFQRERCTFPY